MRNVPTAVVRPIIAAALVLCLGAAGCAYSVHDRNGRPIAVATDATLDAPLEDILGFAGGQDDLVVYQTSGLRIYHATSGRVVYRAWGRGQLTRDGLLVVTTPRQITALDLQPHPDLVTPRASWPADAPAVPSYTVFSLTVRYRVWPAAISPDGKRLAAQGAFWDLGSGRALSGGLAPMHVYGSCAFSSDGSRFAAADRKGRLTVWSVGAGKPRWSRQYPADTASVQVVGFAAGGNRLVVQRARRLPEPPRPPGLRHGDPPRPPMEWTVEVLECAEGQTVWSAKTRAPTPMVLAGRGEVLLLYDASAAATRVLSLGTLKETARVPGLVVCVGGRGESRGREVITQIPRTPRSRRPLTLMTWRLPTPAGSGNPRKVRTIEAGADWQPARFSLTGHLAALRSGHRLQIWQMTNGKLLCTVEASHRPGKTRIGTDIAFNRTDTRVAFDANGRLVVLDLRGLVLL